METIVIKTLLGTLIGKTQMKAPLDTRFTITNPVEIQNIIVPTQSRVGGAPGIAQTTNMIPLPSSYIHIVLTEPYYFYFPSDDSLVVIQYLDTLKKNPNTKKLDS